MEVTEWQGVNISAKAFVKYLQYYLRCITKTNNMGAHLVKRYITETETEPDAWKKYEFDPKFGLPERKERGSSITKLTEM